MISGLLVDLLVVGAVLAFSWGAVQLGGLSTLGRLFEATVAFAVAALLRDPAGSVVDSLIDRSDAFNNLVGMVIVALATWIVAHSLFRWWRSRRAADRAAYDGETGMEDDPLDSALAARLAGGILGVGWSLLFLALLVLQPASTPISRAAVDSRLAGVLIEQRDALEWLRDGFPSYTQTLPKGTLGAVTAERDDLPLREPVTATSRGEDADALLREINDLRRSAGIRVLTFNPDVAAVARRHALALARDRQLSTRAPSGSPLDARVIAALGAASGGFGDEVGVEVVWAHDPATAMRGLLADEDAQAELRDERWTEVGIGVADMGWFNGRIYVVLLAGPDPDQRTDQGAAGAAAAVGSDATGTSTVDGLDAGTVEPTAEDGDGVIEPGEASTCEFGSEGCAAAASP